MLFWYWNPFKDRKEKIGPNNEGTFNGYFLLTTDKDKCWVCGGANAGYTVGGGRIPEFKILKHAMF